MKVDTTIGVYRVLGSLGAGGMGEVWRAEDTKLGREVALKMLPEDFADDADRHARFEREAKVLASLNHPNIATLFGLEHVDGSHVLVMELVEGNGLDEIIAHGPLPIVEAISIARQIADALEAAHEAGIVHRDLKPANIKVTDNGTVKVLDFGLAKAWETETDDSSVSLSPTLTRNGTLEGVILGTAAYMSPEQARGKRVDRRGDIWAFGVVLWEMLTGGKLFEGETVSDVMAAVLTFDPDLSTLAATVPVRLSRVLERCLRRDLSRRYQSIGDVRIDLQEILEGPAETAADVGAKEKWVSRSLWKYANWVVGGGFAVAFALSLLQTTPPPEGTQIRATIPAPPSTAFDIRTIAPGSATLSPDGSKAVFSAQGEDGLTNLWIYELETGVSRMLDHTRSAHYPFWSPDSNRVGFFTQLDRTLKVIDADGGPAITLCDAVFGKGGTWSPDGMIVFAPGYGTPLHVVSQDGGDSRELTSIDLEKHNSHRHPRFLPDGRRFLFLARTAENGRNAVMIGSLDGDEPRHLTSSSSQVEMTMGHLLFVQERSLMARPVDSESLEFTGPAVSLAEDVFEARSAALALFSSSQNGLISYHSGEPEIATVATVYDRAGAITFQGQDPAWYQHPMVSPDGSRLVVSRSESLDGDSDLWIGDLKSSLWSRFTLEQSEDIYGVWMPDGRGIVFASNRSGPHALYKKAVIGSGLEEPLWSSEDALLPTDVTPDGRFVLFDQYTGGAGIDIWLFDQEAGEARPILQTHATETEGQISPDGRWMAYQSNESVRHEIYVTPFPGGGRSWQISQFGGMYPYWRSDGSELVYTDLEGLLYVVPVSTSGEALDVGRPAELFRIGPPEAGGRHYSPGPNFGEFYVFPSGVRGAENTLHLIVNWQTTAVH